MTQNSCFNNYFIFQCISLISCSHRASQVVLVVKNLLASAGKAKDKGLITGSGRFPGGGNGNPLQYSCLKNSMDGGAWQATVHGVAKSQTQPSTYTHIHRSQLRNFKMYPGCIFPHAY